MRIWIINHYGSTPDQPSTSAFYIARELVARGADVTIFASAFNYYFQKDSKSKGFRLVTVESYDGVTFLWLRTPAIRGALGRGINIASYTMIAFLAGLFRRGRPDVVIGVCPHPGAALSAWLLSALRGGKFIYEIRDIWPESLRKYVKGPMTRLAYRMIYGLQSFLYRQAHLMLSVLPEIGHYLEDRGFPDKPHFYAPNGIYLDRRCANEHANGVIRIKTSAEGFNFVYCGGFSRYQGVGVILEAFLRVSELVGSNKVRLHMVGEGSEKVAIRETVAQSGARNVMLYDAVPRDAVQDVLAQSDCNLYHLSDIGEALRYGISPNKLMEYLASGRPLVYAMPRDWSVLREGRIGVYCPPDDPDSLAKAMRTMAEAKTETRTRYGAGAASTARKFDVVNIAGDLHARLLRLEEAPK